ncbi:conserved hypothetical protein [Ricinus communis]|uniref:Uncharacterized protein n=1 Tax=Ricinus communis TaxID=3988 RepID=B9SNF8_RICCO|nr:conserved hypothetical protein [Ricinus communis]
MAIETPLGRLSGRDTLIWDDSFSSIATMQERPGYAAILRVDSSNYNIKAVPQETKVLVDEIKEISEFIDSCNLITVKREQNRVAASWQQMYLLLFNGTHTADQEKIKIKVA